jgi:polyisoprenoid-binding protein YceI
VERRASHLHFTLSKERSSRRKKDMSKHTALSATAVILLTLGILALKVPGKTTSPSGSWLVDTRHSDAQLSTDGMTDFGKTKMTFTIGNGRINGRVTLDNYDSAKSSFDFRIYPATSMVPSIDEGGKFLSHWLANMANQTMVCFHSKGAVKTSDGRLQTSGNLLLTRVDRNVEATPDEAYAGPVYGPPMIHRISREAKFVFDFPADSGSNSQKDGGIQASGSTNVVREDFPQLLKSVISTYWPPVVQDEKCQYPAGVSEAYSGSQCTGTYVKTPVLPEAPQTLGEDFPGPSGFNTVVGEHLTILVHMHLTPVGAGAQAAAGN